MWFLGEKNYSSCLSFKKFAEKQWNTRIKKLVHNEKKQHKWTRKKIAKVTTTRKEQQNNKIKN
jgi:hypothetical protein